MSELRYTWDGQLLGLKMKGLTKHELRCLLLGLWWRLSEDDQLDFIAELNHYCGREPHELPPLSQAIAFGECDP